MNYRRLAMAGAGAGILLLALIFAGNLRLQAGTQLIVEAQAAPTATVTLPIGSEAIVHFSVAASAESETALAATPVTAATPEQTMRARVDQLLEQEEGIYGVMIVDGNGNLRYSRNGDVPFISASLYKLLLVADVLGRIEREELSLDQQLTLSEAYFPTDPAFPDGGYGNDHIGSSVTVNEAMWSTICVSSNVSAQALLALTTADSMNRLALDLGMEGTYFSADLAGITSWPPSSDGGESGDDLSQAISLIETESLEWKVNLTTPSDIAIFFDQLLKGGVVSDAVSEQLLALLFDQQINDRIPALLPEHVAVANKTGNLESIVHDAGVMMTGNGPVILVIMSEGVPDEHHTTLVIEEIAAIVFDELK